MKALVYEGKEKEKKKRKEKEGKKNLSNIIDLNAVCALVTHLHIH